MTKITSDEQLSLDDLYKMTAYIYGDRNSTRTKESTFAHLVEVCGMLTVIDRKKKKENFDMVDGLCKALGWYFPLLAKLKVKSVEDLVFRKFPNVCPYCRKSPHDETICKQVKGTENTVDHSEVSAFYKKNWKNRPRNLNEWQEMFARIYPRSVNDASRSTLGLMEELGEMAEAVRVFDAHPHYLLGEAADIFSYLMGMANEHALRELQDNRKFDLGREFITRYPGLCSQCGSRICVCPAIPSATIGRMAKELEIGPTEIPFETDLKRFAEEGKLAATTALESVGGYAGLADRLPFDRGDANHALVQLCLKIAEAVEGSNSDLATSLRAQALRLGDTAQEAGTLRVGEPAHGILDKLRSVWREMDPEGQDKLRVASGMTGELVEMIEKVRVLFVYSNPVIGSDLDIQSERRSVREAIRRGRYADRLVTRDLPAATPDDLRRELLENEYDVLQFSGHSNEKEIAMMDAKNQAIRVPMLAIKDLVAKNASIKCLVLTSCKSGVDITTAVAPYTVVMDEVVDDDVANAYSTGFFDAIAAGRTFERSHDEGMSAVSMGGMDGSYIRLIKQ